MKGSLLAIAALYVISTTANADIDLGLVAHYEFEGNAQDSVGHTSASWTGTEQYTQGVIGQAAELDGSSFLDTGLFQSLPNDFSVALWFSIDVIPNSVSPGLISTLDGALSGFDIRVNHQQSTSAIHSLTNDSIVGVGDELGSGVIPQTGIWYHVVVTYEQAAGHFKIFVDGDLANEEIGFPAPLASSLAMAIGANRNYSRILDGRIDDVRVYDRVLSETDVEEFVEDRDLIRSHLRFKETDNKGIVAIARSRLKNLGAGSSITANFTFDVSSGSPVAKSCAVDSTNPTSLEKTPGVDRFRCEYLPTEGQFTATYKLFNTVGGALHTATMQVVVDGVLGLSSTHSGFVDD